jgi:hypothetical protein
MTLVRIIDLSFLLLLFIGVAIFKEDLVRLRHHSLLLPTQSDAIDGETTLTSTSISNHHDRIVFDLQSNSDNSVEIDNQHFVHNAILKVQNMDKGRLAICAPIYQESRFITEWLIYYRLIGMSFPNRIFFFFYMLSVLYRDRYVLSIRHWVH